MKSVFVVIVMFAVALFAGCSKEQKVEYNQLGAAPDSTIPVLRLEELLKNPTAYSDKFVVAEGGYGGACGDGDYYFKDKFDMIEFAFDQGSEIEKFKLGTPLRLYGKVKVRMHSEKNEKDKSEASITMDVKGVEYQ